MLCKNKHLYHHPLENHSHDHDHGGCNHTHKTTDKKMLKLSIIVTTIAMLIQFIYSILTHSLALLSDTLHMFSHVFALCLSYFAIWLSEQKSSDERTFGYYRIEVIVAFINSITTAIFAVFILYEAVEKIFKPEIIDSKTMIFVAIFGLLVNAITGFLLIRADMKNINIKSSFLHMMSDLLSSVGVVIGGIAIYFTNAYFIDSLLAVVIAFVIAKWSYSLIRQSIDVLMESSPVMINSVKELIESHKDIVQAHDIHISEITHNMYILTAHIVINQKNMLNFQNIVDEISHMLLDKFNIGHCTFQPEFIGSSSFIFTSKHT